MQFTNQFSRVQATMLKCLLSKFIKFVTSKKITSNLTFKYNKSTSEKTKPLEMIGKQPSCMLRYNYEVQWQWLLVRKINSLKCLPLDIHYMVAGSRYRSWTMVGMSWLHPTLCLPTFHFWQSKERSRRLRDIECNIENSLHPQMFSVRKEASGWERLINYYCRISINPRHRI